MKEEGEEGWQDETKRSECKPRSAEKRKSASISLAAVTSSNEEKHRASPTNSEESASSKSDVGEEESVPVDASRDREGCRPQ